MKYRITHTTHYRYNADVARCFNKAHIIPREIPRQACLKNAVQVKPEPAFTEKRKDYFGNWVYQFAIQNDHSELTITAESEVEMRDNQDSLALDFGLSCADVKQQLIQDKNAETIKAREYCLDSPMIRQASALSDYAQRFFPENRPFLMCVREFSKHIYESFKYDPGFTTIATPVLEVLEHKRGVCQDFAHFAIACLRSLGYSAQYVSGYLETLPPPGQEKLVGADATHAWFSVYSPGEGWYEFDPTNNQIAGTQHIVTATGRDFSDVTPLSGVIFGGGDGHALDVGVTVTRLANNK